MGFGVEACLGLNKGMEVSGRIFDNASQYWWCLMGCGGGGSREVKG